MTLEPKVSARYSSAGPKSSPPMTTTCPPSLSSADTSTPALALPVSDVMEGGAYLVTRATGGDR